MTRGSEEQATAGPCGSRVQMSAPVPPRKQLGGGNASCWARAPMAGPMAEKAGLQAGSSYLTLHGTGDARTPCTPTHPHTPLSAPAGENILHLIFLLQATWVNRGFEVNERIHFQISVTIPTALFAKLELTVSAWSCGASYQHRKQMREEARALGGASPHCPAPASASFHQPLPALRSMLRLTERGGW